MKIAFDENVPLGMVRVFSALSKERRFQRITGVHTIECARDYTPQPGDQDYVRRSDVPWLKRFAAAGGQVVISGNIRMRDEPHELLALRQLGFIVIFFEGRWSAWKFHRKCALLLNYWPVIVKKLRVAKPGEFWCVPNHWAEDGELRDVTYTSKEISKLGPAASARAVQTDGKGAGVRRGRKGVRAKAGKDSSGTDSARATTQTEMSLDGAHPSSAKSRPAKILA